MQHFEHTIYASGNSYALTDRLHRLSENKDSFKFKETL